ncbi:MAG: nuclear transport factor 2 family protein, partial [Desulfatitalea sp.]|nr:nuclear transport factor 2 family protein [Desulfatitalea sp.]
MKPDAGLLRIGLKYCGGCKPGYDRVAAAERIAAQLRPKAVLLPPDSPALDLILVMQGCPTACADLAAYHAPAIRSVTSPAEADRFIEDLLAQTLTKEMGMPLTREEIQKALADWNQAWARYDLDGVMSLMHDDVVFENWTGGKAVGKTALADAWRQWFAGGGFRFIEQELFIDETAQKVLFRWVLEWPCPVKGYEGRLERRKGVDVMHLQDGRII